MHLVVGDIHGCYKAFRKLLKKSKFKPARDKLWLTGDLVNRGPKSANVVRYVMDLGDRATVVLGNHDLHLLAIAAGVSKPKRNDNSHLLLDLADAPQMIDWLAARPMAVFNKRHDFLLVHASVHKNWSTADTLSHAGEIEVMLRSSKCSKFLSHMYGSTPENWNDNLTGWNRLRAITNILTRTRFCHLDGSLDLTQKGPPGSQPKELYPWYAVPGRKVANQLVVFGHWSALGFAYNNNTLCLDSGYLWGGQLTALKLKKKKATIIQIEND